MRKLKNAINLDRAKCAADNISKGEEKMSNSSKKTPWFLCFAPGAILRQIGLAVLALTMLFGVQSATAQQIAIDSTGPSVYYSHADGTGHYEVGPVYVFGLGPANDVYNYPQWRVTSLWVDDPNSDLDLTALRAKIASINATFVSDLSSAMESYMNSIDSITTKCATNTRKCWTKNSSLVFPGCANPNLLIWAAELDSAIDAFESAVASAITTANDAMAAWINYIN